jgi:hypothetical protein
VVDFTPPEWCCVQAQQVKVEQLIVGVLLFVPLLALLPTVFVWHTLLAAARLAVLCITATLRASVTLVHPCNPAVVLAWRLLHPMSFPGKQNEYLLSDIAMDRLPRGKK